MNSYFIRDVVGYEGIYWVLCNGSIITQNNTVRKTKLNSRGYPQVTLSKNGKKKTHLIHKIVADAFLDKPPGKKEINHKDGNKLNNRVSNLEWCTRSENLKHACKNGLKKLPVYDRSTHPNAKITLTQVAELRSMRNRGVTYKQIADHFKISIATAHKIYNHENYI